MACGIFVVPWDLLVGMQDLLVAACRIFLTCGILFVVSM